MTKKITNLALGAALVCVAASATAGTITQDQLYGPSAVPFTTLLTFNDFDSYNTHGTLTSVTITLTTSATAEVDIINIGASRPFTGATAVIPVTASGPGGASASTAPTAGPFSGTAAPGLNAFPGLTATASGSTSPTITPYIHNALGIVLTVDSAGGTFSGTSAPGLFFGGSATASGDLEVVYTYTAAATPDGGMTLTLLGAALTGAALLKRRFVA